MKDFAPNSFSDRLDPEFKKNIMFNVEDVMFLEDLNDRRIMLNGYIDETTVENIVYHIIGWNREDIGIPIEERKPIRFYINSKGGSVVEGFSIIDIIQCSNTPVYTINIGMCASMAFLVFIAGHERYSLTHSQFLMHDGDAIGCDSTAKMKDRMLFETIEVEEKVKKYVLSRMNITEELYDNKYRIEWYFFPEDGKKYGAVDYIVNGLDCSIESIL